jgi:hypothetical protein
MNTRTVILALVPVGAAIATIRTQHETFRGRWFVDAPSYVTAFTRCGAHDKWLAVLDSSLLAKSLQEQTDTALVFVQDPKDTTALDSAVASLLPPPIFAVVQGDTSPRGSYGPKGAFTHRLLVHELDTIPTSERAKCT